LEQQLKLHIEGLQGKLEESEKIKEAIARKDFEMIDGLKRENRRLEELLQYREGEC